ncbi:MAG: hypothetical protein A3H02_03120 [Candidatus Niyogibacteria bacterium RIFCSPLOWO2_12_FULL_41_13]|uniref:Uncharacterized protein n=1 Tax=Candidatus Niyogibacteria bacterium RIFCSPLOWO2_12_FULL_41_13 TaxID=1801726 RepID=A0A1G2F3B3_9BACT|nr:MAG: hypothetical protein A3H02_03120 [Candidatus Niyogibacteria bacterium RIFCSPLOWO2_12_FULL_41_13]
MKVFKTLFLGVSEDISKMIELADNEQEPVVMEFNEVIVVAYPGEDFNTVYWRYSEDSRYREIMDAHQRMTSMRS